MATTEEIDAAAAAAWAIRDRAVNRQVEELAASEAQYLLFVAVGRAREGRGLDVINYQRGYRGAPGTRALAVMRDSGLFVDDGELDCLTPTEAFIAYAQRIPVGDEWMAGADLDALDRLRGA